MKCRLSLDNLLFMNMSAAFKWLQSLLENSNKTKVKLKVQPSSTLLAVVSVVKEGMD